ncbi:hypothetical protein DL96DRAFT_713213 [Flagelloscypha sp. PMI_526]|nr:hypothetical protein DL96DRAFT_713213 [Flagelloscypha sp. PMI_526]
MASLSSDLAKPFAIPGSEIVSEDTSISFPFLPLDLAQQIIEVSAASHIETALTLSVISKEVQPWVDKYLFETLHITSNTSVGRIAEILERSAHRLQWTRTCAISSSVTFNLIPRRLFSLPNLVTFCSWHRHSFVTEFRPGPVQLCPSLRLLSCDPRLWAYGEDSNSSPNFNLPIFKYITHLDLLVGDWNSVDWLPFRSLCYLTHILVEVDWEQSSCPTLIVQGLLPSLPPSVCICVLDYGHEEDPVDIPLFDQLRLGQVDERILMGNWREENTLPWVLCIDTTDLLKWATSRFGGDDFWLKGLEFIEARKTSNRIVLGRSPNQ